MPRGAWIHSESGAIGGRNSYKWPLLLSRLLALPSTRYRVAGLACVHRSEVCFLHSRALRSLCMGLVIGVFSCARRRVLVCACQGAFLLCPLLRPIAPILRTPSGAAGVPHFAGTGSHRRTDCCYLQVLSDASLTTPARSDPSLPCCRSMPRPSATSTACCMPSTDVAVVAVELWTGSQGCTVRL